MIIYFDQQQCNNRALQYGILQLLTKATNVIIIDDRRVSVFISKVSLLLTYN